MQLLVILVIVALIFGTKRLKEVGGDLGGAIRSFKKAMATSENDEEPARDQKQLSGNATQPAEKREQSERQQS
jgi:sec-independent protein translocase protein TatA